MVRKVTPAAPSIESLIKPVSAMDLVIAALFYGRSGTGKTTLAASFPGPILLIDFNEKGWDSVSDHENLEVIRVTSWEMVEPLYWYIHKNSTKYKTIIIDQVSSMQGMCRLQVTADTGKSEGFKYWGTVSGEMLTWLGNYRNLIDLGINVVFLAHLRSNKTDEDEDDDETLDPNIGPMLMPSVAEALQGAVKIIGNTYIRERYGPRDEQTKKRPRVVEYCLRVGPNGAYRTKLRTPKGNIVPSFVVDPSYEKLYNLMKEGFKKPEVKVQPTTVKRKVQNG